MAADELNNTAGVAKQIILIRAVFKALLALISAFVILFLCSIFHKFNATP